MSATAVDDTVTAPALRVVPGTLRGAGRMVERSILVYRRTWLIIVSGFFEPLFYLLSIRIGFGSLVGDVQTPNGPVDYAVFVAPALMASSAMNGA
ncbi:MAG: ABC transporter, partial [Ilumatobacteraceae bacterium]